MLNHDHEDDHTKQTPLDLRDIFFGGNPQAAFFVKVKVGF